MCKGVGVWEWGFRDPDGVCEMWMSGGECVVCMRVYRRVGVRDEWWWVVGSGWVVGGDGVGRLQGVDGLGILRNAVVACEC
jgi:hypothetical protein